MVIIPILNVETSIYLILKMAQSEKFPWDRVSRFTFTPVWENLIFVVGAAEFLDEH